MPRLIVTSGVDDGREFELDGDVVDIGRDSQSGVRLYDSEVSRRHARVRLINGAYQLEDLGSANGVFLNGRKVQSAELRDSDRVQVGHTTFKFVAGSMNLAPPVNHVQIVNQPGTSDLPFVILNRMESAEGSRILGTSDTEHSPWLRARLANLNIIYEAIQAVSHILDLDQLLDKVLELLFGSVEADRGCILVRDNKDGPLLTRAARWREGVGPKSDMVVSRTIIDYVLQNQQGVQIADAGQDERFSGGQSILRYGIRESICVPLTGRHECVGVLYFDTIRPGRGEKSELPRFDSDHLALAIAVAHQAALAVEETRYYQALVQSERLAAVGHAIAALSHHIKNMLQGLKSGGELLKLGMQDNNQDALRSGWRLFEKNEQRIYNLVLDMLSYSKEREPNCETTDLNLLIKDIVELMQSRATENGITLSYQQQPATPVWVDPEGIHRAILNLVGNAIDATTGTNNGMVSITLRMDDLTARIHIEVTDNGVGMTAEQMKDLFQPFQSTKGARGTGLGLAVSRKIIREHGGDIFVTSQFEHGSRFRIEIPIRSETLPNPKPD